MNHQYGRGRLKHGRLIGLAHCRGLATDGARASCFEIAEAKKS